MFPELITISIIADAEWISRYVPEMFSTKSCTTKAAATSVE